MFHALFAKLSTSMKIIVTRSTEMSKYNCKLTWNKSLKSVGKSIFVELLLAPDHSHSNSTCNIFFYPDHGQYTLLKRIKINKQLHYRFIFGTASRQYDKTFEANKCYWGWWVSGENNCAIFNVASLLNEGKLLKKTEDTLWNGFV